MLTPRQFIAANVRFFWRAHLGILLGVGLASSILTGALVVGDSVRFTLHQQALARLGRTVQALVSSDHFIQESLAEKLVQTNESEVAPVLLLNGTAVRPDGSARANEVQVIGASVSFWDIGNQNDPLDRAAVDEAVVNARLARQLHVHAGDSVVIRVELPSLVARDAPLSGRSDSTVSLRVCIRAVLDDEGIGRFSLQASQVPPMNVFIPLATLQQHVKRAGQANVLLSTADGDLAPALKKSWTLKDAGIEVCALGEDRGLEIRSERVFLGRTVEGAVRATATNAAGVLSYFATELRHGTNATPYSFITATGDALGDGDIAINQWLADDLAASTGSVINLRYFVIGDRRELTETTATFRVTAVLPTVNDPTWTPAFPGLAEVVDCGTWDPGIPMDATRIRPKDETYWKDYRGTPKAFVSLAAGQKLWGNRFGQVTALRVPERTDADRFASDLLARLEPADAGLHFTEVRRQALTAGGEALDFGQLFLSLSFFLIVAALALTTMLFTFQAEQRQTETGLLRALGFVPRRIVQLAMLETATVCGIGALIGVVPGLGYTWLALRGLASVWSDAVGGASFHVHAATASLAIGPCATAATAFLSLAFALRRQQQRPIAELLSRGPELELQTPRIRRRIGLSFGAAGGFLAALLLAAGGGKSGMDAAGIFFGAGTSLLVAGLGLAHAGLALLARRQKAAQALWSVGLRAAARRPGRTLTSIGVLAAGLFLVVATGAFRQDAAEGALDRASGTGGFAFFARSSLPIYDNLDTPAGRAMFGLEETIATNVSVIALRVRPGDEASCLNLNRAQQPNLWGVQAAPLATRHAFSFVERDASWLLLDAAVKDDIVPAIGDQQSVQWALGRKTGDVLELVDEHGRPFRAKIVATLKASILQGGLLISERNFTARFPNASGHRMFLIDAPTANRDAIARDWSRGLRDRGFEVMPAARRLAEFNAVSNTYLAIFQVLGGLGVLLGVAGFGMVAVRNGFERRRELAVMKALGFNDDRLRLLLAVEHLFSVAAGLAIGVIAALVATRGPDQALSIRLLLGLAGGALAIALCSLAVAIRVTLRGSALSKLRPE